MNYTPRALIFLTLAILVINTTHPVSGQYQPIYFLHIDGTYVFASDAKYYAKMNIYFMDAHEEKILAACPRKDNPHSLEIVDSKRNEMIIDLSCKQPVQPSIYKMALVKWHIINTVGYAIYTPGIPTPEEYIDAPMDHAIIPLITFEFDFMINRIKSVLYELNLGQLLKPELDDNKTQEYQTNDYFYNYDIDIFYSQPNFPYVKVPLAPEEDFFFDAWKSATRENTLTAPMWRELLPQWQALEKFTRKVTRIIESVIIRTGVHGTLIPPNIDANFSMKDKFEVPQYFYRVVFIDVLYEKKLHQHGILFVMHNTDPNATTKPTEQKICPQDEATIAKTGWKFFDDDKFKSPMYGCLLNDKNMDFFGLRLKNEFKSFNLDAVPKVLDNPDEKFKFINVLEEMQKLEEDEKRSIHD